jgi:hypothetical protein
LPLLFILLMVSLPLSSLKLCSFLCLRVCDKLHYRRKRIIRQTLHGITAQVKYLVHHTPPASLQDMIIAPLKVKCPTYHSSAFLREDEPIDRANLCRTKIKASLLKLIFTHRYITILLPACQANHVSQCLSHQRLALLECQQV